MATAPAVISFTCPTCGKNLQVPGSIAGKVGKCSGCGLQIQVPASSAAPFQPLAPPPIPPTPTQQAATATVAKQPDPILEACPDCGAQISKTAMHCPRCGRRSTQMVVTIEPSDIGRIITGIGILGILFFLFGFDSSARVDGIDGIRSVHNLSRSEIKLIGIIVSAGVMLLGRFPRVIRVKRKPALQQEFNWWD